MNLGGYIGGAKLKSRFSLKVAKVFCEQTGTTVFPTAVRIDQ